MTDQAPAVTNQQPAASEPKEPPLRSSFSRNFAQWLLEEKLSIGFTTYQSCRLFLLGVKPNGRLSVFERLFDRAMGLYSKDDTMYLATRFQIWKFQNILTPGEVYQKTYDKLYVPRVGYTTGELDTHDIAIDKNGRPIFVSTTYCCLATLSEDHSFKPIWKPPFISKLVPEDRCHLNGLAMEDGEPAYVTAVSRSDVYHGWRDRRTGGGIVMDVRTGEVVCEGLSMPHSPRLYQDKLWVLNSGEGELGYVDKEQKKFVPVAFCPGYLRGLAFHGHYAIVGMSKCRKERTFSGLPLDEKLKQKDTDARCGLMVVDLRTGDMAHWMELEGVVIELYDVQAIQNTHCPTALGFKKDEIRRIVSIEGEDGQREGLAMLPPSKEAARQKALQQQQGQDGQPHGDAAPPQESTDAADFGKAGS
ncbi:MAG: TIGR03032 family protein [Sumerlaeia bacterium]